MKSSGPPNIQPSLAHAVGERGAVAIGELPQGRGPDAPLEMEVELHLGEGTEVSHPSMVDPPGMSVPRSLVVRCRATRTGTPTWPVTGSNWSRSSSPRSSGALPARGVAAPPPSRARPGLRPGRHHRPRAGQDGRDRDRRGRPLGRVRPSCALVDRTRVRRRRCGRRRPAVRERRPAVRAPAPRPSGRPCRRARALGTRARPGRPSPRGRSRSIDAEGVFRTYLDDVALAVVRAQGGSLFVGPAAARGRRSTGPRPRARCRGVDRAAGRRHGTGVRDEPARADRARGGGPAAGVGNGVGGDRPRRARSRSRCGGGSGRSAGSGAARLAACRRT